MGLFYKELYYLISDYTSAPTPISILRPHPDVLQLHLINFCTFPYVKHPKRRGLWTRVYFGVHELTSFGFASFSTKKKKVKHDNRQGLRTWVCFTKNFIFNIGLYICTALPFYFKAASGCFTTALNQFLHFPLCKTSEAARFMVLCHVGNAETQFGNCRSAAEAKKESKTG